MSTLKVSTISPLGTDATKTITIGESGGTLSIASGANTSGFGKIGQVLSAFKDDDFTTTSTSLVDITGLSVTITPSSTSSKILIHVCGGCSNSGGGFATLISLFRDSTEIGQSTDGSSSNNFVSSQSDSTANVNNFGSHFLDSPSTTSAVTYKLKLATQSGRTAVINRRGDGTARNMSASITVMEVLD